MSGRDTPLGNRTPLVERVKAAMGDFRPGADVVALCQVLDLELADIHQRFEILRLDARRAADPDRFFNEIENIMRRIADGKKDQ